MIESIQTALIELFETAREESDDGSYPKKIEVYGGELKNPRGIINTPALYVDVSSTFSIEADDVTGELHTGMYTPEIILFAENKASGKAKHSDLAKLMTWSINAMKGKVITVEGVPVVVAKKIQGRTVTDFHKPFAILRPTLTISEGE